MHFTSKADTYTRTVVTYCSKWKTHDTDALLAIRRLVSASQISRGQHSIPSVHTYNQKSRNTSARTRLFCVHRPASRKLSTIRHYRSSQNPFFFSWAMGQYPRASDQNREIWFVPHYRWASSCCVASKYDWPLLIGKNKRGALSWCILSWCKYP